MGSGRTPITMVALAGLVLASCGGDDGVSEQQATAPLVTEPSSAEAPTAPMDETAASRPTVEPPVQSSASQPPSSTSPATIVAHPELQPVAVFTVDDGLATNQVAGVDVGTDGTVWAITEGEPASGWLRYESYAWFDGTAFVDVGSPDLLALDDPEYVSAAGVFGMDASGGPNRTLWVANTGWDSTGDAYLYDGAEWSSPIDRDPEMIRGRAAPDGSLWMISMANATIVNDDVLGISPMRVDGNAVTPMPSPEGGIPCGFCAEYEFDSGGRLWMWTPDGLSSFDGTAWTRVEAELPSGGVGLSAGEGWWTLGADDTHWFINNTGSLNADEFVLSRYDGDEVVTFPVELTDPVADKACIAEAFDVAVDSVADAAIAEYPGKFSAAFQDFAGDADGKVWLALECSGVYRIDVETGDDLRYGLEDGLPTLHLRGLSAHADGSVWVATDSGAVRIDPTR